jgi:hypothetical protein
MWWLIERVARLLEPDEREAVLGDLAEGESPGLRGLLDVLGLVLCRQVARWDWRSGLMGAGLSFGGSLMLMGISVSVSSNGLAILRSDVVAQGTSTRVLAELVSQSVLLLGCAWSGGYFVALRSRRTLWASGFLCCLPCCFCFSRFCIESLSPWCLLLFLAPALAGGRFALRDGSLGRVAALSLALVVTASMLVCWVLEGDHWTLVARIFDPLLIGPAWYPVWRARQVEAGASSA